MRSSRENGRVYEFIDTRFQALDTTTPDVGRMHELADVVEKNWKWAWTTEAKEDRDAAVKLFEEKVGTTGSG